MRRQACLTVLLFLFLFSGTVHGAHILEPLGTETAATPPRGRMFGQLVYSLLDPGNQGSRNRSAFSVEFEAGIGERTQLNLESESIMSAGDGGEEGKGIEEISFGLKHRVIDETEDLPDIAFGVDFAPSSGFEISERSILATLIFSKNINPQILLHTNMGYGIKTGISETGTGANVHRDGIGVINITPIYKAIPDKLMLMTELNIDIDRGEKISEVTFSPEVIFVVQTATFLKMQNMAFKFAFPVGLTGDSPDFGVRFGVSKLF